MDGSISKRHDLRTILRRRRIGSEREGKRWRERSIQFLSLFIGADTKEILPPTNRATLVQKKKMQIV